MNKCTFSHCLSVRKVNNKHSNIDAKGIFVKPSTDWFLTQITHPAVRGENKKVYLHWFKPGSQLKLFSRVKEKVRTPMTKIGMTLFVSFQKTLHNKLKINMKTHNTKQKITLQHCSQWEQTSVWNLIVDLRWVKKCLDGNRLIHKVACWARKALILCRSSFFTLSGTSAAEKEEQGGQIKKKVLMFQQDVSRVIRKTETLANCEVIQYNTVKLFFFLFWTMSDVNMWSHLQFTVKKRQKSFEIKCLNSAIKKTMFK